MRRQGNQIIRIVSTLTRTFLMNIKQSFSFIFQCSINIAVECLNRKGFVVLITFRNCVFVFVNFREIGLNPPFSTPLSSDL
jgi:hypothetical protein